MELPRSPQSFAHRLRKLFISIHRWVGLILGAWLVLVAGTGSLMAWRSDISAAEARSRYPVSRAPGAEVISLARADAALRAAYPFMTEADVASVGLPSESMPYYAYQHGRRGRRLTFLVDAYTGTVHRPYNPRETFMGTVNQLHTRLLSGFRGYVANGALSIGAVLLLLSGLYVWWPSTARQWKERVAVKRGVSLNRTLYDTHNVLAIYLYPLLLILAVTAPLMVGEHVVREGSEGFWRNWNGVPEAAGRRPEGSPRQESRQATSSQQRGAPGRGQAGEMRREGGPSLPTVAVTGARRSDDELLGLARAAAAGVTVSRIRRPVEAGQAVQVTLVRPYGISRSQSLFLNPYTGEVLADAAARVPERESAFMRWVHQLHFGEYGGSFSKAVYTVAGLLPLGLFATGVTLFARKRVRRKKAARAASRVPLTLGAELNAEGS